MAYSYTVYDRSGTGSYAGEEYSWADRLTITEVDATESSVTVKVSRSALGNNINIQSTTVAFTCDGQTVRHSFPGHNTPGYGQWWHTDDANLEFPASWIDKTVSFSATDGGYSGSFTFGGYAKYRLTLSANTKCQITVSRTSSPKAGAGTGNLSGGADIYTGDVLKISYSTAAGYKCAVTLNGNAAANGGTHTVNANVTLVSTAEPMATIHRFNGSAWELYLIYVAAESGWQLGQANIFDGMGWDKYY